MKNLNKILPAVSAFVMLVMPLYFGYIGKPTEMGLIIAAGFLGLVFSNLGKFHSFKAAGVEAQLKVEQIEAVLERETEAPTDELEDPEAQAVNVELVSDSTKSVLKALQNNEYTWRYASGLSKETNLNHSQVKASLQWLCEHGYARKSLGKKGDIWASTQDGRYLFSAIFISQIPNGK
ncbi:hypothetical protein [Vibrio sp.]|uniref:hypothetical protein n=1 Tax=Vibrio sp. TaxID=678 RepID=UPI00311F6C7D